MLFTRPNLKLKLRNNNTSILNGYWILVCITSPLNILCKSWNMILRNKFKLVVILFTILTVPWRRVQSPFKLIRQYYYSETAEKVVIGVMTCAGGFENMGRNETKAIDTASEEPLTLIKSVLISAKIWKVKQIEFHIFTDSWLITQTMEKKIDEFRGIMSEFVETTIHFHNVFNSVPLGHERDFIDNIRKCGYVRCFFPSSLPLTIKEILYLDTDVIITGNIMEIWKSFKRKVVTSVNPNRPPQLAALVPNSEVHGELYYNVYKDHFRWIPHVPPRGINSGVMFMNLDAMRKFNWTEKIVKIFKERRQSLTGDQQLINILFHFHLDKLSLFPCQYNFQHLHCEQGLLCTNVTTDPGGIRIMHGAGGMFHTKGRSHIGLYRAFKNFKLEHHDEVVDRLLKPLRKFYSTVFDKGNLQGRVTCFGTIGEYLFKETFS